MHHNSRLFFINERPVIYRPSSRRSPAIVIITLLLLTGGVESNLGHSSLLHSVSALRPLWQLYSWLKDNWLIVFVWNVVAPAFLHLHISNSHHRSVTSRHSAAVCRRHPTLHFFSPSELSGQINSLQSCLASLDSWFCENGLALNPTKSDAILSGTHQRLKSLTNLKSFHVAGAEIPLADHVEILGTIWDVSVATALVSSRLDYATSILFGCQLAYRSRLQRVQNALASITVSQNSSFPLRSTTALLQHLHWLPTDSQFQTLYNNIQIAGLWSSSISCKSSPQLQPSMNHAFLLR